MAHWQNGRWSLLVLFVYSLPLVEGPKNILWGLLLALWLVSVATGKERLRWGILEVVIIPWIGLCALSPFFAIESSSALKGCWDVLRGTLVFWFSRDILAREERRQAIVRHLLLATCLGCLCGWWHSLHGLPKALSGIPYAKCMALQLPAVGHFNHSAIFLTMVWMMGIAASLDNRFFNRQSFSWPLLKKHFHRFASACRRSRSGRMAISRTGMLPAILWLLDRHLLRHQWFTRTAIFIVGFSLLGTSSRSAVMITVAGSLFILWRTKPPAWIIKTALGVAGLSLIAFAGCHSLRERLLFRGSFHERKIIWQTAKDAAVQRPWTGVGLNNFKNIILPSDDPMQLKTIDHAHNLYFNTLAQLGFPGLAALLLLLGAAAHRIWQARKSPTRGPLWFWIAGGAWFAIAATGLSNTSLHHQMAILFFLTLSLTGSHSTKTSPPVP
ncbi:MAG: O-antigen ligase family protein [Verrucomicrobiae bacterium]|nr:O-antigen ligase family protein [Verrucomicrobiae bacterium]